MALGMKNPSYWGPQEKFKEATKKTISPIRTWDVKSGLTERSLTIEQDGNAVYTTQSHFTVKKDPYVTIHHKDDEKTVIAGLKFDGHEGFDIYLGDPKAGSGAGSQECRVINGGNTMTREYRFSPPAEQKAYAWRETQQYEISVADSEIQTSGRDWKLISLTADGEEDELLAVYIHSTKAALRTKSVIFWVGQVSNEIELWGLTAVVGLVERKRRSKDKFNFSAMVGANAMV